MKELKKLASQFLNIADELNERVSAYIDGSNDEQDIAAYEKVREYDRLFVAQYNKEYALYGGFAVHYGLNYELAESVL